MDGSRSSDDKAFQAAGPDVKNALGPNVDVSVLGTTSWLSSADRSRDRPKTEEVGDRYLCDALADLVFCLSFHLSVLCVFLCRNSNNNDITMQHSTHILIGTLSYILYISHNVKAQS